MLGPLIDTVIGMVLLFAVLGVVNTVIVEAVGRIGWMPFNKATRDVLLKNTLVGMLGGERPEEFANSFAGRFLGHPLVTSLTPAGSPQKPSYIPAHVFSTTLMALLDAPSSALPVQLVNQVTSSSGLSALVADLGSRARSPSFPDALDKLLQQLRPLANELASASAGTDIEKALAMAKLSWPSFSDLFSAPARAGDLVKVVELFNTVIPKSWSGLFAPVERKLRGAFGLDDTTPMVAAQMRQRLTQDQVLAKLRTFSEQVDAWEANVVSGNTRGLAATYDGIGQLIDALPDSALKLKVQLKAMWQRVGRECAAAEAAVTKFTSELEDWYTEVGNRAAGFYKRQSRVIGLVVALLVCAAIDADALNVLRTLSSDPNARAKAAAAGIAMAQQQDAQKARNAIVGADCAKVNAEADAAAKADKGLTADQAKTLLTCPGKALDIALQDLQSAALPVGWVPNRSTEVFGNEWNKVRLSMPPSLEGVETFGSTVAGTIVSAPFWKWVVGILISALAATLGGEYWFKVLDEVVRLTGPRPGDGGGNKPRATTGTTSAN